MEADEEIFAAAASNGVVEEDADADGAGFGDADGACAAAEAGDDDGDGDEAGYVGSDGGRMSRERAPCGSSGAVRSLERMFRVRFKGWRIKDRPERLGRRSRCRGDPGPGANGPSPFRFRVTPSLRAITDR